MRLFFVVATRVVLLVIITLVVVVRVQAFSLAGDAASTCQRRALDCKTMTLSRRRNIQAFLVPPQSFHDSNKDEVETMTHTDYGAEDDVSTVVKHTPMDRRSLLARAALVTSSLVLIPLLDTDTPSMVAHAYDKTYPVELQAADGNNIDAYRERQVNRLMEQRDRERRNALRIQPLTATVWGTAAWFASGSRSNPVLTYLANVFYDAKSEDWLQDRNDGWFANVPVVLYVVLAIVLFAAGAVVDAALVQWVDPAVSFPLAGVSLCTAAVWDLGRVASGNKSLTRVEAERAAQLEREFAAFVQARLLPGGNCHRQDLVRAFRRYYAKYRRRPEETAGAAASVDTSSPSSSNANNANAGEDLTDLEIERLIRAWSRTQRGVEMSSSGFYSGVQINTDADVFVQR